MPVEPEELEDSEHVDSVNAAAPDPEATHDAQVDEDEQPFLQHLIELRQRLLRSAGSVFVLFFPIYYFANDLYEFIAGPLLIHLDNGQMIATEVGSPFLTPLKLAVFVALIFSMPVILHQLWGFVSPGLYLREKRFARPLLVSSIALFYLGMAFAYYAVFPLVFQFIASVAPESVSMTTDINSYLNFVLKMVFAFGIAFEIPVATFLLVLTGLTTPDNLARKRPYVFIGCFVVGMLLTPPDMLSQILLAVPAWMLFEVGIALARMVKPRADDEEEDAGDEATDTAG